MSASLDQSHYLVEIPDLNRFRIGDKVRISYPDWDRTEAVIIGIELRREHGAFKPDITLLHDGNQVTDGFEPVHLWPIRDGEPEIDRLRRELAEARAEHQFSLGLVDQAAVKLTEALGALEWMAERDDRNGSLPEAYRNKIDGTLAALRAKAEETQG